MSEQHEVFRLWKGIIYSMKVVIQRVNHAAVAVDGETIGKIGKGLLIFLGVGNEDTKDICDKFIDKISKMRIFEDRGR